MVKTLKHIALFAALAFMITGCNPGIIDAPPSTISDIARYFWNDSTHHAYYQRTNQATGAVTQKFSLQFTRGGTNLQNVEITDLANPNSKSLIATVDPGKITISNLSAKSLIPLADGFSLGAGMEVKEAISIPKAIKKVFSIDKARAIAIDASDTVYYSTNSGQHWQPSTWEQKNGNITAFTLDNSNANSPKVYAGTDHGSIYTSTDYGYSWSLYASGNGSHIYALSYSTLKKYLYYSTDKSVYRSYNGITTAKDQFDMDFVATSLVVIDSDSLTKGTYLYAGTASNGLYSRSLVDGKTTTWEPDTIRPELKHVSAMCRLGKSTVIALLAENEEAGGLLVQRMTVKTPWSVIPLSLNIFKYLSSPLFETTALVASDSSAYIVNPPSKDNQVLRTQPLPSNRAIHDISGSNGYIIIATDSGIVYSTNSGDSWNETHSGIETQVYRTRILPGTLTLLKTVADSMRVGSVWTDVGTLLYQNGTANTALRIDAHILHHDDYVMLDSVKYPDVFEIEYSCAELKGITNAPSIHILFAKDIGPLVIDEYADGIIKTRTVYKH